MTVDLAISRRLELAELLPCKAVVEMQQRKCQELGCAQENIAGAWAFYAGPGSPMNHAMGLGLYGPVSERDFERLEEFYRSRNTPCEIVASPFSDRSLFEHIGKRGYTITEFNTVLMFDLRMYDPVALPPHIRAEDVCAKNVREWAQALIEGFAEISALPPETFTPFAEINNNLCKLALIDDQTAGATGGAIFTNERIAAFYGTATIPRFRRRGIQTAMLHERLAISRHAGCDIAVITTQPGSDSQRNAERVGFRVAYTKIVLVRKFE